jgi:hypothetical protein
VKLSGRIAGLPDINKLAANLELNDLSTTETDISSLVPPGSMPNSIRLPPSIALNGSIRGNMSNMQTNLNLRSTFGNAGINATLSNPADSIHALYNAQVVLSSFDVGKLIKNEEQVGKVSMNANVKGKGYTPSGMEISANGNVASAEIKNYNYRNLVFDAKGSKGIYKANADIDDPNIDLDLVATANLNGAYPDVQTTVMVDSISLLPLHFGDKEIRIHSKVKADFPNLDIDNLVGKLEITELLVNTEGKRFVSDTILVNATRTDTGNTVTLTSQVISAGLNGKYTLSGIGTAAQQIINRYYHTGPPAPAKVIPHNVSFYVKAFNSPFLRELMPSLVLSDSIVFTGNMNTDSSSIVVNGKIPALSYGTNQVKGGSIAINTTDSALVYAINISNITGTSFRIPVALLNGSIAKNTIAYNLSVHDDENKEKYLVAGTMHEENGSYALNLLPGGLKLDYDKWMVNPQNRFEFGKAGIRATAFEIGNADQLLSISSQSQQFNSPLSLKFTNFHIESLTKIAEKTPCIWEAP